MVEDPHTTVVALHGFTGSGLDFVPIAQAVSAYRRIQWIAPDLPGHGKTGALSGEGAHSLSAMAGVIQRFIRHRDIEPFVMGYSMGGRLALTTALVETSIKALTLIGATAGIKSETERKERRIADRTLAQRIRQIGAARFAEEWDNSPMIRSQSRIAADILTGMKRRRREQSSVGLALSLNEAGTGCMKPCWDKLHRIECPTLVIAGDRDEKFQSLARNLVQRIPQAHFSSIPSVGHCAHLEGLTPFCHSFRRLELAISS